jgi:hypothetical protein
MRNTSIIIIPYISIRIKYKAEVVGKHHVEQIHEEHEHKHDELQVGSTRVLDKNRLQNN